MKTFREANGDSMALLGKVAAPRGRAAEDTPVTAPLGARPRTAAVELGCVTGRVERGEHQCQGIRREREAFWSRESKC